MQCFGRRHNCEIISPVIQKSQVLINGQTVLCIIALGHLQSGRYPLPCPVIRGSIRTDHHGSSLQCPPFTVIHRFGVAPDQFPVPLVGEHVPVVIQCFHFIGLVGHRIESRNNIIVGIHLQATGKCHINRLFCCLGCNLPLLRVVFSIEEFLSF